MEERSDHLNFGNIHKIVICGPESTGKTTMAGYLAEHYKTAWVPEYARTYISELKRAYNYQDLVQIVEKQIFELKSIPENAKGLIFYDTGLIITKIWFKEVYNKYPIWLDDVIENNKPALYLLCYYDLQWEFDILRENGSLERRAYLFNQYKSEIEKIKCTYWVIKGISQDRFNLAVQIVDQFIRNNVSR